jgi:hypothetical protein
MAYSPTPAASVVFPEQLGPEIASSTERFEMPGRGQANSKIF